MDHCITFIVCIALEKRIHQLKSHCSSRLFHKPRDSFDNSTSTAGSYPGHGGGLKGGVSTALRASNPDIRPRSEGRTICRSSPRLEPQRLLDSAVLSNHQTGSKRASRGSPQGKPIKAKNKAHHSDHPSSNLPIEPQKIPSPAPPLPSPPLSASPCDTPKPREALRALNSPEGAWRERPAPCG